MKTLIIAVLVVAQAFAASADRSDITLVTGEVLKAAKIVAVGEKTVTISHAGGIANTAVSDVPTPVLDLARRNLKARQQKAKELTDAIASRPSDVATLKERVEAAQMRQRILATIEQKAEAARTADAALPRATVSVEAHVGSKQISSTPGTGYFSSEREYAETTSVYATIAANADLDATVEITFFNQFTDGGEPMANSVERKNVRLSRTPITIDAESHPFTYKRYKSRSATAGKPDGIRAAGWAVVVRHKKQIIGAAYSD